MIPYISTGLKLCTYPITCSSEYLAVGGGQVAVQRSERICPEPLRSRGWVGGCWVWLVCTATYKFVLLRGNPDGI